ncbi:LOW QUALITY PROTEIN: nuclear exosome regulator NRDE2 [Drosophila tropicalis]|uniref:LOW QUALITY PROTEIN: nuclear exosome regulator NRDE2 n=1 Tax=Drosophila tropicalis TaxID=46794 RepID=UPI0035ABE304
MSLFPAYGNQDKKDVVSSERNTGSASGDWKTNQSYDEATTTTSAAAPAKDIHYSDSDSSDSSPSDAEIQNVETPNPVAGWPRLEFDGKDEFFVDKKWNNIYREWETIPRLSHPIYKVTRRQLRNAGGEWYARRRRRNKQNITLSSKRSSQSLKDSLSDKEIDETQMRMRDLIALVTTDDKTPVDTWLEFNKLLEMNLERLTHFAKSERQMHYLEMALQAHVDNEQLLQCYINTANITYPASQVATLIERMLEINPFNYSLWTALIMATQGTMARCNVPDVLKIYERSMQRMHLGHSERGFNATKAIDSVDTDDRMLKLFHNCILFLRQSSNCNQMFALLKLALELNVPGLQFDCFEACAADEVTLDQYEECVLKSGLPMPQIWTRIERLRQSYHFLPYPQMQIMPEEDLYGAGLDAQRYVYNSDICQLMYPLKSESNRLHLLLLAVQLVKMPFIHCNGLAQRLCAKIDQIGDSDAIEMLLAGMGDRLSYALPRQFGKEDYDIAKAMCVTPTFMPHTIGHEFYAKMVRNLLLKSAEAFPEDEEKRRIFIILWFRFERVCLSLQKFSPGYIKLAGRRMRHLLSQGTNRESARFYAEMAMFEFETFAPQDDIESVFRIFRSIISSHADSHTDLEKGDLLYVYMIYAEMLISRDHRDQALQILTCIALMRHATTNSSTNIETDSHLALTEGESLMKIEFQQFLDQPKEMKLEEYFVSHKWLILLRARCLLFYLMDKANEAAKLLQKLLQSHLKLDHFQHQPHERKNYMRERIQELRTILLQLPVKTTTSVGLGGQLLPTLEEALIEFPRNHYFLRQWANQSTLPWFRLRAVLIRTRSGILSLLHMLIAAQCRLVISPETQSSNLIPEDQMLQKLQNEYMESIFRNRILNMFEALLPGNPHRSDNQAKQYETLRRNSLFWRCYLQILSDKLTSFASSHKCLLTALDECPWDKALYMDGAVCVPQEFDHLQDVMTEKGLRIYALPEELDVLRAAVENHLPP